MAFFYEHAYKTRPFSALVWIWISWSKHAWCFKDSNNNKQYYEKSPKNGFRLFWIGKEQQIPFSFKPKMIKMRVVMRDIYSVLSFQHSISLQKIQEVAYERCKSQVWWDANSIVRYVNVSDLMGACIFNQNACVFCSRNKIRRIRSWAETRKKHHRGTKRHLSKFWRAMMLKFTISIASVHVCNVRAIENIRTHSYIYVKREKNVLFKTENSSIKKRRESRFFPSLEWHKQHRRWGKGAEREREREWEWGKNGQISIMPKNGTEWICLRCSG